MIRMSGRNLSRSLLVLSAIPLLAAHVPAEEIPAARAAAGWTSGVLAETQTVNCASVINGSPINEYGIGSYVSYQSNPVVGSVYYLSIYVAGVGNPCSGTNVFVDFQLPASTVLMVSAENPIVYLYDGQQLSAAESPQTLGASGWNTGALTIAAPNSSKLWPLAQGHNFEFLVPVASSVPLVGAVFRANLWGVDGYYDQWIHPTVSMLVSAGVPQVTYPSPATSAITANSAHSVANLFSGGRAGTAFFDLGTTTSYGLIHETVDIPLEGGPVFQVYDDWSPLQPGTTYHWRVSFTPTGGATVYGADQTFTTTGASSIHAIPIEAPRRGAPTAAADLLGRIRSGDVPTGSGVAFPVARDGEPAQGRVEIR